MTRMFAGIGTLAVCAVLATTVAAGMQGVKPITVPRGDGAPGMVTYPQAAAERATDGWLELRLQ